MEKNSPINSVYLIALATVSICGQLTTFYNALIFGVVVLAVYYVSLSIVSMIDKITDNHVRFILYTFISSALIIILKVLLQYVGIKEVVFASETLEVAILPCMILAIAPIYFESTFEPKKYVGLFILVGVVTLVMFLIHGVVVEIFGNATICGKELNIKPNEAFTEIYASFFIVATLSVLFNLVRRAHIKRKKRFEILVDRYKIIISDIREEHPDVDFTEFSGKGGTK